MADHRLRVLITTGSNLPEAKFAKQLGALRDAGATFDERARTWFVFLDLGDVDHVATVLSRLYAAATEFGLGVTVESPTQWSSTA